MELKFKLIEYIVGLFYKPDYQGTVYWTNYEQVKRIKNEKKQQLLMANISQSIYLVTKTSNN